MGIVSLSLLYPRAISYGDFLVSAEEESRGGYRDGDDEEEDDDDSDRLFHSVA